MDTDRCSSERRHVAGLNRSDRVSLGGSTLVPLGALCSRLGELPGDKDIVTFCRLSLRGYEAARILQGGGFEDVRVMDGGIAAWPFEKLQG